MLREEGFAMHTAPVAAAIPGWPTNRMAQRQGTPVETPANEYHSMRGGAEGRVMAGETKQTFSPVETVRALSPTPVATPAQGHHYHPARTAPVRRRPTRRAAPREEGRKSGSRRYACRSVVDQRERTRRAPYGAYWNRPRRKPNATSYRFQTLTRRTPTHTKVTRRPECSTRT